MGHGGWNSPWDDPRGGARGRRGSSWSSGPPPWLHGLIELAQSGGHAPSRGPKVRRGDVRAAILDVLAVEPMNGYQVIQQIAERSGGAWKPSPGSVYPTVQQLEDEGLVEGTDAGGRRVLQLTDAGRDYVGEHPDELAATWRAFDEAASAERQDAGPDLKPLIGQVLGAVWQVVTTGTRQQQAEAAEILADTRRRLYGLLADGDVE
jgi:DNA-binding PadR family transcriptional regulator